MGLLWVGLTLDATPFSHGKSRSSHKTAHDKDWDKYCWIFGLADLLLPSSSVDYDFAAGVCIFCPQEVTISPQWETSCAVVLVCSLLVFMIRGFKGTVLCWYQPVTLGSGALQWQIDNWGLGCNLKGLSSWQPSFKQICGREVGLLILIPRFQ